MKAKEIVTDYINALNKEDFSKAITLVTDDLFFDGVLGQRHGAQEYFADMEKMKLKYEVVKTFEDGEDVCVLCNVGMGDGKIFTCIWYKLAGEKIKSLQAVFDPTPIYNMKK